MADAPDLRQPPSPVDVDVLVVGAGPTGLTAACEALRHGLTVRIVDRKQGLSTNSKALVTHARTMEVLETMGVAAAMLDAGVPFAALHAQGGPRGRSTRVDLLGLPWGDTSYPFWLSIPQYATEQVLERQLQHLGGTVEWGTTLLDLNDHGDQVAARVEVAGEPQDVRARWVIGCDGGRSTVRDRIGLRLDRRESGVQFLLADVSGSAPLVENEGYAYLAPQGLLVIVPMPEPGRWRIIAHVDAADGQPTVDATYLDGLIAERSGLDFGARAVGWTSRFTLSHGVADAYRRGRVFLAGDAAHVHSPVGGQGLNTGIQDAHNLLWKLAEAGRAPNRVAAEALLDSYEDERRTTAKKMVAIVDRMTTVLTLRSGTIRRVLGWIAPRALAIPRVSARLGRGAGMLEVAYPGGPLDEGAGTGRRLPNPEFTDGSRLYARLPTRGWCWVVWVHAGEHGPDINGPRWHGLPVILVRKNELLDPGSVPSDAEIALVRPDRVLAGTGSAPEELRQPIHAN